MKPNRRLLIAIPVIIVIGLTLAVVFGRRGAGTGVLEASGTVEAIEANLGFTVPGRIEAMAVQEGDSVHAGEDLAHLDRAETLARRDQAEAQVNAARANLLELQRGSRPEEIAQAQAASAAADERLADAQRDFDRMQSLLADNVVSQQEFDKAKTRLDVARAEADGAREALGLVEAGPRRERIESARASLISTEAQVRTFEATLANMTIRAPFDGLVTVRHHEPGEIVQAGAAVVTLLNRDDRWVKIYVPETRIGATGVGQPATITTDTYGDREFEGEVSYVASQAEFTPKTVQTREERVKLVYAVKVRISGDPEHVLKPGMPADVVLRAMQ